MRHGHRNPIERSEIGVNHRILTPPTHSHTISNNRTALDIENANEDERYSDLVLVHTLITESSLPGIDLQRAFTQTYPDDVPDAFYKYLERNNALFSDPGIFKKYYGKFCAVIQSSGTGKSRLLTEVIAALLLYVQWYTYLGIAQQEGRYCPVHESGGNGQWLSFTR